ncbi:MAG: hypothetical protein QNJ40_12195 [Xanthomonadales bacterium]|nr:hypothetical protein [Xanthomonadales bacterium]
MSRRNLLGGGIAGAAVLLGSGVAPSLAAPVDIEPDFGPDYSVKDVYRIGRHTYVELGFEVNGLPFDMRLRSMDGKTWWTV